MAVSADTLEAMTREIVDEAKPSRVLLFGSQARGDARDDSDVDLMVVCDEPLSAQGGRRNLSGRIRKRLKGFGVAKDVLVFTEAEMDIWKDEINHCIARALEEGRVLYER